MQPWYTQESPSKVYQIFQESKVNLNSIMKTRNKELEEILK